MTWSNDSVASLWRNLSPDYLTALDVAIREARASQTAAKHDWPSPLSHGHWLNVRPDPIDFRDTPYQARLVDLAQRLDPPPELDQLQVRNQGDLSSCTGMALALGIDLVRQRQWGAEGSAGDPPQPVSARMLYEMGLAFDEHPQDGLPGSSVRGVFRGFFHNGVCLEVEDDDSPESVPHGTWRFTIEKAKQARSVLLGVYMRLSHRLLDYHCALNEMGFLVVSAKIHKGWQSKSRLKDDGRIVWTGLEHAVGGHAFVLVGYDDAGFLVRNSWGEDWSQWTSRSGRVFPGVAHWSYEDWQQNVMDTWAIRLAVPTRQFGGAVGGYFKAKERLRPDVSTSAPRILVNGHYLHIQDGRFVTSGTYNCDEKSLEETARLLRETQDYRHLMFIVESGLDSMKTMVDRAVALTPYLKEREIYPMFVWWREGVYELASELLDDRARRLESRTGGLPTLGGRMLESFARDFLQPLWRTFEGEAERAFSPKNVDKTRGQGWLGIKTLLEGASNRDRPLRLHIMAHGAGAVWVDAMCQRLLSEQWQRFAPGRGLSETTRLFDSVSLLAPVCREDLAKEARSLWSSGDAGSSQTSGLGVYTLSENDDRTDRLGAYQGSFLELARRVFPIDGWVPKLGQMPNQVLGHARVAQTIRRRGYGTWFRVDRTPVKSSCRTHLGLARDPDILKHVLDRILATVGETTSDRSPPAMP